MYRSICIYIYICICICTYVHMYLDIHKRSASKSFFFVVSDDFQIEFDGFLPFRDCRMFFSFKGCL